MSNIAGNTLILTSCIGNRITRKLKKDKISRGPKWIFYFKAFLSTFYRKKLSVKSSQQEVVTTFAHAKFSFQILYLTGRSRARLLSRRSLH